MTRIRSVEGRGLPVVVGVLCVLAVGMTTATLDTAEFAEGEALPFVPPNANDLVRDRIADGPGTGVDDASGESGIVASGGIDLKVCIPFLNSGAGALLVFGGLSGVVGLLYRRYGFSTAMVSGWVLLSPTMLLYFLATNCGSAGRAGIRSSSPDGALGSTPLAVEAVPVWMLAAALGLVLAGAVGLLYRSVGADDARLLEADEDEEDALDGFAAAAGRAADRIEEHNADVDNAVYRAWVEMTGLSGADRPETYTPGEFAESAVELGMDAGDVAELTRLFNEVRYGGRDAGAREARALAVLRNIEEGYGTPRGAGR